MKLPNLLVCLVILALVVLWLAPAAAVWFEERVCSPALGWLFIAIGRGHWLTGLALLVPCAVLFLLAAIASLIGRARDPLRDRIERLNHS